MARPIEYDKEKVLENAMNLFWRKGYEATSMKDIVQATGLNTRTMYNMFQSKSGLFKVSLEYYYESVVEGLMDKLRDESGLKAISNYIEAISECSSSLGCFLVNTDAERNIIDSDNLEYVDKYFEELEKIFFEKLNYAHANGDYADEPKIRARQLVLILKGFSLDIKNTKNIEANRYAINDMIRLLNIE